MRDNLETDSPKIIDCFIFYNELDLLNYRLNILNPVVDYFVIVESTHKHMGNETELLFNKNKSVFDNFKDKIIHIIVDDFPYKYPNIDINQNQQWINENFHRNCISRGIELIKNKNDNDLIIISDLDEIPDPTTLLKIKNNEIKIDIHGFEMDCYYYNLNTKIMYMWFNSKIFTFNKYKNSNQSLTDIRMSNTPSIKNGGWHLSYFGDSNFIQQKVERCLHRDLINDNHKDITKIENMIKTGKDLYNRNGINLQKIPISENDYLPPEYDIYLKKYYE
jgi:beta-1,4-mannosyl-glycoprotein beta-1,4-N-acetylglucosaminyltransferase